MGYNLVMKIKTDWNFDLILTLEELKVEKERVIRESHKFIDKWQSREDYLTDPGVLAEALTEYQEWERATGPTGKLGYYWGLKQSLDQTNPEILANLNLTTDLANRIQNDIQFFEIRLSKIDEISQKKFLSAPELKDYAHFLSRLWEQAKHLLSEPEEKIMNLKANSSSSAWERMTSGLVSKEEREVLGEKKNFSEIYNMINDTDKKKRDAAAASMNDIMERWVSVGEAEMNAILNDKKVNDELRKMESPEEARFVADDVDPQMVNALVDAVSDNYQICADFFSLKAKLLGVSKLEYYERQVPYGEIDKSYSFDEAGDLVGNVFLNLDKDFKNIFERLLENGQVDVFPKKGKRGGAFCSENLLAEPTYVLMNYNDKLESVLTLAHEFGHAINNEMMRVQIPFYFHTSLATAEVASTFFEGFVLEEIMKEADEELRLALMVKQLDDDMGTIFRQIAMYQFERELHLKFRETGYVPKEEIGNLWVKHALNSMGPAVNKTSGVENWWLYVPHIRSFFYVYSYASGQLISKVMQAKVKKDKGFIENVKEFLSAGSSKSPKDLFMDLGIDVSNPVFWTEGILEIERNLSETQKLAKKLGKV